MTHSIDDSQRKAARVIGIAYLFAMAASVSNGSRARGASGAGRKWAC